MIKSNNPHLAGGEQEYTRTILSGCPMDYPTLPIGFQTGDPLDGSGIFFWRGELAVATRLAVFPSAHQIAISPGRPRSGDGPRGGHRGWSLGAGRERVPFRRAVAERCGGARGSAVHLGERESPRIGPFVVQGCQNGPSNLQVNCEDGGVSTGSKRFQIGPAWIAVDLLVVGTGPVARSSVGSKW